MTLKLTDKIIKGEFKILYDKFVIVPFSKTGSNFALSAKENMLKF